MAARLLLFAFAIEHFANRAADPDFWGQLASGRLICATGAVPQRDVFSYLPTRDWLNYEWLANVIQYGVHHASGDAGIIVLKTLIGVGLLVVLLAAARFRGATPLAELVIAFPAVSLIGLGFAPRAQVFTYLFFGCWLYALMRARTDPRWLFPLPMSMVIWANLHAGFLAGLGLPVLFALGEVAQRRPGLRYVAVAAVSLVATLVNPYGLRYWSVLREGITIRRPGVTEWVSVPLDFVTYPEFKALLVVALATLLWWRQRDDLGAVLTLAVTAALAWKVQRHLPLFGIAAAMILPGWLTSAMGSRQLPQMPLPRARDIAFTLLFSLGAAAFLRQAIFPADSASGPMRYWLNDPVTGARVVYPAGAVGYMKRERLRGNCAVEFNWGLFVANALYPQIRVSADGRNETVYDPEVIEECRQFFLGNDPESFLRKYPTDLVLTDGAKLRAFLEANPRARLLYADEHSCLYRLEPESKQS